MTWPSRRRACYWGLNVVEGDLGERVSRLVENELAGGLLQYFDPVERGRALAVNRHWRVVGAHLEARDEAALWQLAPARDSRQILENSEQMDNFLLGTWTEQILQQPQALHRHDPLTDHLRYLWEQGFGGRVEDHGWSSTNSFANLFWFLNSRNVNATWLIIAPESEIPKWVDALRQRPPSVPLTRRFNSAFASLVRELDGIGLHLHLCSYQEAAESWAEIRHNAPYFQHLILDEGAGVDGDWPWRRRGDALSGVSHDFFALQTISNYVLYQRRVMTLETATFHYYFIRRGVSRLGVLLTWADTGDRFANEIERRAICSHLSGSILSAAPGFAVGRAYEHARARNFASRNESFARGFEHTRSENN